MTTWLDGKIRQIEQIAIDPAYGEVEEELRKLASEIVLKTIPREAKGGGVHSAICNAFRSETLTNARQAGIAVKQ